MAKFLSRSQWLCLAKVFPPRKAWTKRNANLATSPTTEVAKPIGKWSYFSVRTRSVGRLWAKRVRFLTWLTKNRTSSFVVALLYRVLWLKSISRRFWQSLQLQDNLKFLGKTILVKEQCSTSQWKTFVLSLSQFLRSRKRLLKAVSFQWKLLQTSNLLTRTSSNCCMTDLHCLSRRL